MLIFHEGLPGSGKSYEALAKHIIPALEKGRKVFAYVEGLNHERIAEVAGISLEKCRALLIPISREEVPRLPEIVENDALIVVDELQNFWPVDRLPLNPQITQFVTEHRHRGLDILAMGQDLRDCHNLWRRRVSQKVVFTKLEALGLANRYRWVVYKAVTAERFEKITSGTSNYDPRYFGCYASHTDGTENTATYQDQRANLFRSSYFRFGLPAAVAVGVFAISYLFKFFSGGGPVPVNMAKASPEPQAVEAELKAYTSAPTGEPVPDPDPEPKRAPQPAQVVQLPPPPPPPVDYFDDMAKRYRLRLSALMEGEGKLLAYVDALDNSYHLKERFTVQDLEALGWTVTRTEYGLDLSRGELTHIARPWPLDPFGRVADQVRSQPQISGRP